MEGDWIGDGMLECSLIAWAFWCAVASGVSRDDDVGAVG